MLVIVLGLNDYINNLCEWFLREIIEIYILQNERNGGLDLYEVAPLGEDSYVVCCKIIYKILSVMII